MKMKINIDLLQKWSLSGLFVLGILVAASIETAAGPCPTYNLRSSSSNVRRELTVVNTVHDRSATLYWVDFNGRKRRYATIPPKGKHVQSTYLGHVWVVENSFGYCDSVFIVRNNVEIRIK